MLYLELNVGGELLAITRNIYNRNKKVNTLILDIVIKNVVQT